MCTKSFSKRNFSSKFWNFSWLFSAVLSFIFHFFFSISVLYPKLPLAYFLAWLPGCLWIHWKRSDTPSRIFTWIRKTRNSRSLSPNQKLWFQPYGLLELGGLSTTFSILHQKRLANSSLEKYDWWFLLNFLTSKRVFKSVTKSWLNLRHCTRFSLWSFFLRFFFAKFHLSTLPGCGVIYRLKGHTFTLEKACEKKTRCCSYFIVPLTNWRRHLNLLS